jgi:hypothetical protein
VGSVILDDIVYPDGRTQMAVLGGGGTHAVSGMNVWGVRPLLLGAVGQGLPETVEARLAEMADVRGLVRLDLPQIRGWQLFEWDGKRTEIFRVEVIDPFLNEPQAGAVPAAYDEVQAIHVLRNAAGLLDYRRRFPRALLLWEPEQHFMTADHLNEFRDALPHADIVTPNLLEASLLYGEKDAATLLRRMLDDGAAIAVLRLGEEGSLVGRQGETRLLRVPAVPVPEVVDVTGAGNTYGGGFLVGWRESGDLARAAAYGAVAASFCIEGLGALRYTAAQNATRDERLDWALARAAWE